MNLLKVDAEPSLSVTSPPTSKVLGRMLPAPSPTVRPRWTVRLGSFLSRDHSKALHLRLQGGQPWGPTFCWQPLSLSEPLPVLRFISSPGLGPTDPPWSLTSESFFKCKLIPCLGLVPCPNIASIALEAAALPVSTLFWFSSVFTIHSSDAGIAHPLTWGCHLKRNNKRYLQTGVSLTPPQKLSFLLCAWQSTRQRLTETYRGSLPKSGGWLNVLNKQNSMSACLGHYWHKWG